MTHFTLTLADGREFVVESDDEETARQRGNDYGSRVVSVEESETPADDGTGDAPAVMAPWTRPADPQPDPQE